MEREGKAGSYIARFKKVNVRGESDAPTIADDVFQIGRSLTGYFGWVLPGLGSQ